MSSVTSLPVFLTSKRLRKANQEKAHIGTPGLRTKRYISTGGMA